MIELIKQIRQAHTAKKEQLIDILRNTDNHIDEFLFQNAMEVCEEYYHKNVFFRGLIEMTNYCKNDCYYCGIRAGNTAVRRYRLTKDRILACCRDGYALGFRSFVLQGGEDRYFTDDIMVDIISSIRTDFPDCAITLSIGEKSRESYERYFLAGADRYLLRHETSDPRHYSMLHPDSMSLFDRIQCLKDLKEIGFQVGAGVMVGSPYQKVEYLADDLLFLKDFAPHMVGIGPFIPHDRTVFAGEKRGSVKLTLRMMALTRLMLPKVLLPSTTALGTVDPNGREKGLKAGCNVVMPNLSPVEYREDYGIYNGKLSTGEEAAESRNKLCDRITNAGFIPAFQRGDMIDYTRPGRENR